MAWPITTYPVATYQGRKPLVTQGFRPVGGSYPHLGVDIMFRRKSGESSSIPAGTKSFAMPLGVPAVASADGRVKWVQNSPVHGGGIGVVHRGRDGSVGTKVKNMSGGSGRVLTMYSHLYGMKVKPGQVVKAGTVLGYIGDSPSVKDPRHLHFEVRQDGKGVKGRLNPSPLLKGASLSTGSGASGIFNYVLLGGVGYGVYRLLKWRGIL